MRTIKSKLTAKQQALSAGDRLKTKLRDASKMYEQQFLRTMVKAMRGTVDHSSYTKPSMAEKIYKEQLDDQYVESWVDQGGTGFADVIYNDLVDKFYPYLEGRPKKQIRPMNITDRFQGISPTGPQAEANRATYKIQLDSMSKNNSLRLPWSGKITASHLFENGTQKLDIAHPLGLSSTLIFKGQVHPGLLNKTLGQGEIFADLKQEAKEILWQLRAPKPQKGAPSGTEEEF